MISIMLLWLLLLIYNFKFKSKSLLLMKKITSFFLIQNLKSIHDKKTMRTLFKNYVLTIFKIKRLLPL